MTVSRHNADGTWSPDQPIPLAEDLDVEVYGTGPYVWQAWIGLHRVDSGRAWSRPGLRFALWRAQRRHARQVRS
ncbi:hypothetical protein ACFVOR_14775 [Streptomyces sp. NPDC057837]|uniref:hypothetical protein n=1 Tax=Streptomyces sp. NPDC057837 TaxID=3346260 RepID=UPI0036D1E1FF